MFRVSQRQNPVLFALGLPLRSVRFWALYFMFLVCIVLARRSFFKSGERFGDASGQNVKMECKWNGKPICCEALNSDSTRGDESDVPSEVCDRIKRRVYKPSPYEQRHIQKARELSALSEKEETAALISFITSDAEIEAASRWTKRIHERMLNPYSEKDTADDYEYLSYFEVEQTCIFTEGATAGTAGSTITTWKEWIEPLSVHMRHPFSLGKCKMSMFDSLADRFKFEEHNITTRTDKTSVDHVLLTPPEAYSRLHSTHIARKQNVHTVTGIDSKTLEALYSGPASGAGAAVQRRLNRQDPKKLRTAEDPRKNAAAAGRETAIKNAVGREIAPVGRETETAPLSLEVQSSQIDRQRRLQEVGLGQVESAGHKPMSAGKPLAHLHKHPHPHHSLPGAAATAAGSGSGNHPGVEHLEHRLQRNIFVDAGAASFGSSLQWFLCAYAQRGVEFEHIYGYEQVPRNAPTYWPSVPPKWSSHLHFVNTGISANTSDALSPLRVIQQLATEPDFVSFKLDIDTPEIESPIAQALLTDPSITALVDEFFFEWHFNCGIMKKCGWGDWSGDRRDTVMNYFATLREKGVRAHVWP